MDNEQTETILDDDYTVALDATPEEVRNFIWSPAFEDVIHGIAKMFMLTPPQRESVHRVFTDTLIGMMDEDAAMSTLTAAGISKEVQNKIYDVGYEYCAKPILDRIDAETEFDADEDELPIPAAVSPLQALAGIQERLNRPKSIAPTKRDYSLDRSTTPAPLAIPQKPSTSGGIDPYRETPEL